MNYVLTLKPCYEVNSKQKLNKNIWYNSNDTSGCVFLYDNCLPIATNFTEQSESVKKINYKGNNYFLLTPKTLNKTSYASVNYLNKKVEISVGTNLYISLNGTTLVNVAVEDLSFDSHKIVKNHLILNFVGKRNFVVIINNDELKCATYYDEANIEEAEVYFLLRLFDSLNHGKVFCIKEGKFDSYLVYLDEEDLNLKEEFLPMVFLDLVLAKNFNYAKSLLNESIQPADANALSNFFLDFDFFVPINATSICLLKNGSPCGIAEFTINNNKIENINIL